MIADTLAASAFGSVLLPADEGVPEAPLDQALGALPPGTVPFVLPCHFDHGGPWAGTRDLFRALLAAAPAPPPDLLARHDYELVHVLPELKAALGLRNPSLTDLAAKEERVRNYPADRAIRIVHGLIDLLIELKEGDGRRAGETWVLLALRFDEAGEMTRIFLLELLRRAGARLRLHLVPVAAAGWSPDLLPGAVRRLLPVRIAPSPVLPPLEAAAAERRARELEAEAGDDVLASSGLIPELLRLWSQAGRPEKVVEWRYRALHAFNTLGFYADAIRYGEPVRELFARGGERPAELRWGLFFKLLMSYLGVGDLDRAEQLIAEAVPPEADDPADAAMRIRYCYLRAMLLARFQPERDFEAGERFLEQGLAYLEKARLPEADHHFQLVFNRNGLAMIRSFQGRPQEALDLCREGYERLERHLDPGRHRLHRSVLLYNMAQVYAQIGAIDAAIANYSQAMAMDPNYSEYYNERGNLFLKLGRLDEARRDYRRAIEVGAPYYEVWSNLGQCHRVCGRMEEAIAAYDRSLDLQPSQPMVWVLRAQALEALGRLDEAIASHTSGLELQPALWPALAGRGVLRYEQGDVAGCLADLDRAVALAPHSAELYQNRAVALSGLGRNEEASRDLRRYLELEPEAPDRDEVRARLREIEAQPVPLAS